MEHDDQMLMRPRYDLDAMGEEDAATQIVERYL